MAISKVPNMTLLLVVFLSRLGEFEHVSTWEDYVITKGLTSMHGDFKSGVARAGKAQLQMAQAAQDMHATPNDAGEAEPTAEYNKRISGGSDFVKAKIAYEDANKRVGEAYQTAKETMTESAKRDYENAKEKASKATGDLGATMRENEEL